jgi:Protein of unknown function (DUF2806)
VSQTTDQSWLQYFFESCATISDKEIQKLWAKVLARKVTSESALPRKLIDCLRWLDQPLASEFMEFAPRVYVFEGFFATEVDFRGKRFSIGFPFDGRALEEIGLLRENQSKTFEFRFASLAVKFEELSDRSLEHRAFFEFSNTGLQLAQIVCGGIINYRSQIAKTQPDPLKSFDFLHGETYSDLQNKMDSIIIKPQSRIDLAVGQIIHFLIEIAATVRVEKAILERKLEYVSVDGKPAEKISFVQHSPRDILKVTKTSPRAMIVSTDFDGPHGQQLHPLERRFLKTLLTYLEMKRELICHSVDSQ